MDTCLCTFNFCNNPIGMGTGVQYRQIHLDVHHGHACIVNTCSPEHAHPILNRVTNGTEVHWNTYNFICSRKCASGACGQQFYLPNYIFTHTFNALVLAIYAKSTKEADRTTPYLSAWQNISALAAFWGPRSNLRRPKFQLLILSLLAPCYNYTTVPLSAIQ